jgi:hypothetical protein
MYVMSKAWDRMTMMEKCPMHQATVAKDHVILRRIQDCHSPLCQGLHDVIFLNAHAIGQKLI